MQHEITKRIPLLDEKGNLTEPGYAKKLLPAYRRKDIKANPLRIKEWDYYLITNGRISRRRQQLHGSRLHKPSQL